MKRINIETEIVQAQEALKRLSKTVLDLRKPTPGPYAFFHHNAHALTALRDCANIFARLADGRAALTAEYWAQERLPAEHKMPGIGGRMPPEWSEISKRISHANEHMKLDLESLYVFGGILLDQWSFGAIAIGNLPVARKYPFREMVDHLDLKDAGLLAPLWDAKREEMLWLYYQQRFYRNRFVIHADRPWQRGTTASLFGEDFNLFTPSPPGWLDDEAIDAQISALMPLAPPHIRDNPISWERAPARLIEVLFGRIAFYTRPERETISRLYGTKGGSTPSFNVLAARLFRFVSHATEALIPIAEAYSDGIDLGVPHRAELP